ncbi:hypothetical protein ACFWG0_26430 [Streptomyces yangpuensis]|uniref:hypothetical protein n=1 Tax=Streptomyces yangpuensis TaxID=1648182 RepID=UPI0036636003
MNLTPSQQAAVTRAQAALDHSRQLNLGKATDRDLMRNIGHLEIALKSALRLIGELTEGGE